MTVKEYFEISPDKTVWCKSKNGVYEYTLETLDNNRQTWNQRWYAYETIKEAVKKCDWMYFLGYIDDRCCADFCYDTSSDWNLIVNKIYNSEVVAYGSWVEVYNMMQSEFLYDD